VRRHSESSMYLHLNFQELSYSENILSKTYFIYRNSQNIFYGLRLEQLRFGVSGVGRCCVCSLEGGSNCRQRQNILIFVAKYLKSEAKYSILGEDFCNGFRVSEESSYWTDRRNLAATALFLRLPVGAGGEASINARKDAEPKYLKTES
jgi:hypothetical protein